MNTPRTAVTNVSRLSQALRPRRGTPVLARTAALRAPVAVPAPPPAEAHTAASAAVSPWTPSAPCTPQSCVESGASAAAVPRAVLRFASLLTLLVAGLLLFPVARRIPVAPRERIVRAWCRTLVRATGIRARITGAAPPDGGLLMVANHISWLDIPLLAAVRPARMLAKKEIRQWPVAGPLTALSGALFIDRDRLRSLPDTVARITEDLRGGSAVVVFPEGSTWCGRAQGRFRRAVFQGALDAGVSVQPVRLCYRQDDGAASTAPAFVGSDSLLSCVWRVLTARRLVAEVRVMPVLTPGSATDRRALTLAAQRSIGLPETSQAGLPAGS